MARLSPLKDFSAGKFGSGKLFRPGSFSSKNRYGLAGALRKFKDSGKHSYAKNLSKQDLKIFHGLIGEEMAKTSTYSKGLSYKSRRRIMSKAEGLMRQGKISHADKADLRNIVETMSPERLKANSQPEEPINRAVNFGGNGRVSGADTEEKSYMSPEAQKHIKANIKLGNMREMDAVDRSENQLDHDPKSQLGHHQAIQSKRSSNNKNSKPEKKNDLPDIDNLPDMDIG